MSKYIDAEKLIAEIKKLEQEYINGERFYYCVSEIKETLSHLSLIIASLQQELPEVDLDKEANECWDYVFSAIGWDEYSFMTMNHKDFLAFARHFYELGKTARKEK